MPPAALSKPPAGGGNSIATICWHVAGNLRSRFTDFLTTDGEKPWRRRDEEFEGRAVSRDELLEKWQDGWRVLLDTFQTLDDSHLDRTVTIRASVRDVQFELMLAIGLVIGLVVLLLYMPIFDLTNVVS